MAKSSESGTRYRLLQHSYLRSAADPKGLPIHLEEGTEVGSAEGLFDFEGPPNNAMLPLNDEAQSAFDAMMAGRPAVPVGTFLKDDVAPAAGGSRPADPAEGEGKSDDDKKGKVDPSATKAPATK